MIAPVALAIALAAGAGTAVAAQSSAKAKVPASAVKVALAYTGGKARKANASMSPVTIGFVTMIGGTPSFPEQVGAATATTKFINDYLGGIDGHPLKLVNCYMQSEEDGQRCGAELLAAKVPVVNQALAVIGAASLYKTIAGTVPVLVGTTATGEDSASARVYSFTGGGPAVIYAMAKDTLNIKARNVALVSVGNPGGKYTMEKIAVPALDQIGAKHGKTVYYADTATTPDIVSAVQAAGGSKADVIFFDPSGPQQCLSLYDAMKQLQIDKPVVTTPICNADAFIDKTGKGPENWRIWGFGENPRVTSNPDVAVSNAVMDAYGQTKWKYVGFATSTVRDLLTLARFGNKLGAANFTAPKIEAAIKAFRGPAFMVPGPQNCARPLNMATQSICGTASVGSVFKDGKWSSLGAIVNKMK